MAIADDVEYNTVDKIVQRTAAATTDIYSANALYTWLMDEFDELALMDDKVPMSAQTPTSYTCINGWYVQEDLTKYINGGAIQTSGYVDEVRTLICGATGWVNFVAADIGDTVTGSTTGDTGTILDYDNAEYKLWVRMTSATDLFDNATENYTGAGTGTATATAISTTGESIFANFYTLGTLEGTPTLYVFQDSERIDPDHWSTGHIDVLVKVRETGVDIDSRKITVFCRNWTDTFDAFEITLTTAGQNAVPLGTSDDLNNQNTEVDVEDWQDGTTYTIAIDFAFTTPFTYDIGDGSGSQNYEVQIDCNSQTLDKVYEVCKYWTRTGSTKILETDSDANNQDGEEYRYAKSTYAEIKACPFGTFAGGKFFGARSVYFTNLHADDAQSFQLVDAAGTTRYPPNYQAFSVGGLVIGDRVVIFESDGSASTTVDKAQHAMTTQGAGVGTVTVGTAIPTDTPTSGTIIIVESTTGAEEVLAYTSYTGVVFTLTGTTANAYDTSDTAYVPYIYETASGTSANETTTIYNSDRNVVCRVRIKGILPFETAGIYSSTGYSTTAIRTTDSIVS